MSELIQKNDNCATIRWKLLTGASALALTAYVASSGAASADDVSHPQLWIEFGGQMELLQGFSAPVEAPFMATTPTPDIYKGFPFIASQRAPRFAFGEEGKISFQPENSDWIFSAGIRYGRSHTNKHAHQQMDAPPILFTKHYSAFGYPGTYPPYLIHPSYADPLADVQAGFNENHLVLDFAAGKDVGLGLFGHEGSSTISAGIRFASFTTNSAANISGRPAINIPQGRYFSKYYGLIRIESIGTTFHQYRMSAHARRSFKGIGPTLSWNASAALAGNEQNGELTLDWGINAALLFGKQKAKTDHTTQAYHYVSYASYPLVYSSPHHSTRTRTVTVPNVGGYAGLSVKYSDLKVSIGYRYDTFLSAMDTGIDTAKKSNVTFNGPFASISIGLGD